MGCGGHCRHWTWLLLNADSRCFLVFLPFVRHSTNRTFNALQRPGARAAVFAGGAAAFARRERRYEKQLCAAQPASPLLRVSAAACGAPCAWAVVVAQKLATERIQGDQDAMRGEALPPLGAARSPLGGKLSRGGSRVRGTAVRLTSVCLACTGCGKCLLSIKHASRVSPLACPTRRTAAAVPPPPPRRCCSRRAAMLRSPSAAPRCLAAARRPFRQTVPLSTTLTGPRRAGTCRRTCGPSSRTTRWVLGLACARAGAGLYACVKCACGASSPPCTCSAW